MPIPFADGMLSRLGRRGDDTVHRGGDDEGDDDEDDEARHEWLVGHLVEGDHHDLGG